MRKKIYGFAVLMGIVVLGLSGCKSREKIDLTGIHTSAAETMADAGGGAAGGGAADASKSAAESFPDGGAASSSSFADEGTGKGADSSTALSVRSKIATYKDGKVSIEYPILSNLRDAKTEEAVNSLLKKRATYVLDAYEITPASDTVKIKCNVISLGRSKAVLTYEGFVTGEGAAHPVAVFYTHTMDLNKGVETGLSDYADAYTMAGYLVSDDCVLERPAGMAEALAYVKSQTLDQHWKQLAQCDFPSVADAAAGTFPQTFSYENQGVIYMVIPTTHALGDYAIARFAPDTK